MQKWTNEEVLYLQANYLTQNASGIAGVLNRTPSSITNKVNKLGLVKGIQRKYTLRMDAFAVPDTVNCYWAGFLAADGYIRSELNHVGVRLSRKDKAHLVALADFLGYDGPIKDMEHDAASKGERFTSKTYYSSSVVVCGAKPLTQDLQKHFNITARKSLTLQPPNITNLNQQLAYVVGFIDGDGTLYADSNGRLQLCIECSSRDILVWIQQLFNRIVIPKGKRQATVRQTKRNRQCKNPTYCLKITGVRATAICSRLLEVCTPTLSRKWDCMAQIVQPKYDGCQHKYTNSQEISVDV